MLFHTCTMKNSQVWGRLESHAVDLTDQIFHHARGRGKVIGRDGDRDQAAVEVGPYGIHGWLLDQFFLDAGGAPVAHHSRDGELQIDAGGSRGATQHSTLGSKSEGRAVAEAPYRSSSCHRPGTGVTRSFGLCDYPDSHFADATVLPGMNEMNLPGLKKMDASARVLQRVDFNATKCLDPADAYTIFNIHAMKSSAFALIALSALSGGSVYAQIGGNGAC